MLRNLIYDRYWARQKNVEPTGFPAGIKMQGGESTIDDLVRSGKIAITQGGRSRPRRRGALLLRRALIGTRSERGGLFRPRSGDHHRAGRWQWPLSLGATVTRNGDG